MPMFRRASLASLSDGAARHRRPRAAGTADPSDDITETLAIALRTLADAQARYATLSRALPWYGAACVLAGALGTTIGGMVVRALCP